MAHDADDATLVSEPFGRMLRDYHADSLAEQPRHRRDDGEMSEAPLEWYFTGPEQWPDVERSALDDVRGRVLDAGCGAGRTALWLQEQGTTSWASTAVPERSRSPATAASNAPSSATWATPRWSTARSTPSWSPASR
jgi:SAM-dependent methyltransferase